MPAGGVPILSKDPVNAKVATLREYAEVSQEESEFTESVLVKDVLYAFQVIEGRFVKFDKDRHGLEGERCCFYVP